MDDQHDQDPWIREQERRAQHYLTMTPDYLVAWHPKATNCDLTPAERRALQQQLGWRLWLDFRVWSDRSMVVSSGSRQCGG